MSRKRNAAPRASNGSCPRSAGESGRARKLSEAEQDALPLLSRGSALRFLLTRLVDFLNVPSGALVKPKDPLEYARKLRFQQGVSSLRDYGVVASGQMV